MSEEPENFEEEHNEATAEEALNPEEVANLYGGEDELPQIDPRDAQIEALKGEVAAMKDQMMRVAADAENTKRRALKERDDVRKFAVSSFAKDLLDVADNMRRALDSIPEDLKDVDVRFTTVLEGIEANERAMLRVFDKNGIQKIIPEGELFDPNKHEVMFETPGTGQPGGTIIQVIEPGYILNDRLLRPARVGVAKDEGTPAPQDPGANIDVDA